MIIRTHSTADASRYAALSSDELRQNFLLSLFAPGELELVCTDVDRAVIGSAVPLETPLLLGAMPELRAEYFCERRELGVLNIGGAGTITVDGETFALQELDGLYISRGSRSIAFSSAEPSRPAAFYLLSYPAHMEYPTTHAAKEKAEAVQLGTVAECNQRTLYKYIHPRGIKSCQLVMGFTQLAEGNIWNTMPCHTHDRRSEVYLYFDIVDAARVFHFMGRPDETRHLLVANREAVISPSWSIHSGAGTRRYTFCWGMGGENQSFEDMDAVSLVDLR
jgi:4-deoxy-L-threo-5-hexosulose-uronate ketol-isomerase